MAKFLTGNALNLELERIFENATEELILISPYIKLHSRLVSVLKTKLDNDQLEIVVVFGKNEDDRTKSMNEADFAFFKSFPNIRIYYEQNLHAKYYANESSAILTSMNLYGYSQNNNIEAGVLTKVSLWRDLASNVTGEDLDLEAADYFEKVVDQAELLFEKQPEYESVLLGLSKKYVKSIVQKDKLSDFFQGKVKIAGQRMDKRPDSVKTGFGYCIRTGKEIPFNRELPVSAEAYESWKKFKNLEFPEKFCHFSGEPSNGLTSFARPILRKNWMKARQAHNL